MYECITPADIKAAQIYWKIRKEFYNLYGGLCIKDIYQLEKDTIEKALEYMDHKIENGSVLQVSAMQSAKNKFYENYQKRNKFYLSKEAV